jgi:nickel superoxide dismutase
MQRFLPAVLVASFFLLAGSVPAGAHCEVPCGIYADQARFERMLEDAATMEKAMGQINELAGKSDGQSANQLVRWVNTKEEHATNTQHIIAQYFMTQRLKPEMDGYVEKLVSAHAVMRAAMKCKQSTDAKDATALKDAIVAFHKAYEAKK